MAKEMSQCTLIYGFGYGRSLRSLDLPGGKSACAETCQGAHLNGLD